MFPRFLKCKNCGSHEKLQHVLWGNMDPEHMKFGFGQRCWATTECWMWLIDWANLLESDKVVIKRAISGNYRQVLTFLLFKNASFVFLTLCLGTNSPSPPEENDIQHFTASWFMIMFLLDLCFNRITHVCRPNPIFVLVATNCLRFVCAHYLYRANCYLKLWWSKCVLASISQ